MKLKLRSKLASFTLASLANFSQLRSLCTSASLFQIAVSLEMACFCRSDPSWWAMYMLLKASMSSSYILSIVSRHFGAIDKKKKMEHKLYCARGKEYAVRLSGNAKDRPLGKQNQLYRMLKWNLYLYMLGREKWLHGPGCSTQVAAYSGFSQYCMCSRMHLGIYNALVSPQLSSTLE